MKSILFLVLFLAELCHAQTTIGHTTLTFNDPTRSGGFGSGGGPGRQIQTEVYYPATSAGTSTPFSTGEFPVIVFGHGFAMNWDAYSNIWEHYVPLGYIMAFVRTESGLFPSPSHGNFGMDLTLVAQKMLDLQTTNALFQNHIYPKVGIMGHSMGGGASFLAANNNTNIHALIGLAPAETNPSAIATAPNVQVPSIVFSGSSDGVTPPAQHHIPMYEGITSTCKSFVNIIGGAHCYFANTNFNCDFGESTSSTGISISRAEQQNTVYSILDPWLDYNLKDNCSAYEAFQQNLTSIPGTSNLTTCPNIPTVNITQNGNLLQTSTPGSAYQWFLNGQVITGAFADFYELGPNASGVYTVQVSFPFGCATSPNLNIVGLNNILMDQISISPNPCKDFLNITNKGSQPIQATFITVLGQKTKSVELRNPTNSIPVNDLSPGIYWIKFDYSSGTFLQKCIIE
jgi:predicted dienelactone hydrolase